MPTINRQLTRQLLNLLNSLDRQDAKLGNFEYQSPQLDSSRPAQSDSQWWTKNAKALNEVASSIRADFPDLAALADKFDAHATRLGKQSSKIEEMAAAKKSYGEGWADLLDSPIRDVQAATLRIAGGPNQASPEATLLAQALDMFVEVASVDSSLELFASQGDQGAYYTFPSKGFVENRAQAARRLLSLSNDVREQVPTARKVVKDLQDRALWMSAQAGAMGILKEKQIPFGKGWGEVFDSTLDVLSNAIDVISSAVQAPEPKNAPSQVESKPTPEPSQPATTKVTLGSLLGR
jgi:hypothetical protein